MNYRDLTTKEKRIMDIVTCFGVLEMRQLNKILKNVDHKVVEKSVKALVSAQFISMTKDGKYLLPFGNTLEDKDLEMCDCIWVMLQICEKPGYLENAFPTAKPSVCYVQVDEKHPLELFYAKYDDVLTFNIIREKVAMYNRQVKDKDKETRMRCAIVSRNQELVDWVKNYEFDDDVLVITVNPAEESEEPEIQIKKKKKTVSKKEV